MSVLAGSPGFLKYFLKGDKKMSKRFFSLLIIIMIIVPSFVFSAGEKEGTEVTTLELWTQPNVNSERFWKPVIDEFNSTHGNIQVDWKTIPTGGSSEEIILTAIATGTQPDICTNIFSGFLAQLVENEVVVALDDEFSDFRDLAKDAKMDGLMKGWEIGGKNYELPMYVNTMQDWYNKDLLAKAGLSTPPRTYSEFLDAAAKISVPGEVFAAEVNYKTSWWSRWFDLENSYFAASGGKPYINVKTGRLAFDDKYGRAYLNFIAELFAKKYAEPVDIKDGVLKGSVFMKHPQGPWSIKGANERFPEVPYVVANPLVPDFVPASQQVYVFADTKGMVMFKSTKNKEAAWEFMKWYYSDINHIVSWLEETGQAPAREDLLTNPVFTDFWKKNPQTAQYAEMIPYSIPPAAIPNTVEVHNLINSELWEPIVFGKKTVDEALNDLIPKVQALWE